MLFRGSRSKKGDGKDDDDNDDGDNDDGRRYEGEECGETIKAVKGG